MRLPKNWNQITVEQFQECYFLLGKTPTIDTWVMVLATLSGKSADYIERLEIRELKKAIKQLDFLLTPNLNEKVNKYVSFTGRVYKAVLFADQMQTNQVADLKGLMVSNGQSVNDTIVENCHKLLACIYVPLTLTGFKYLPNKHKALSERFKKAKMGDVYGAVFFFFILYKNLIETTLTFGEKNLQEIQNHMKEVEEWQTQRGSLEVDGDGK